MRASSFGLVALSVAAAAALHLSGCGGGGGGTGGGGGSSTGGDDPCNPAKIKTCDIARQIPSDCIALADYAGKSTTVLRMAQLSVKKPEGLVNPIVRDLVDSGVTVNLPQCNLGDNSASSMAGNFNWLMQFDLTKGVVKTGGALPVADPLQGYTFATGSITQGGQKFSVAPVEIPLTVKSDGTFSGTKGLDLVVPIYQDKAGSTAILLPLHDARLVTGKISTDHNCIGSFDSKDLSPNFNCKTNEPYVTAGTLDAFITLEEADKVDVPTAGTTLCAIIAGLADNPNHHCERDAKGNIKFQGDWCSTSNTAGGCKDSVKLEGDFAAAAVKLSG
ncbi:MAG TPA: hypothetical protein VHB21_23715 [Minicystis sp.]|nr:hypothetical protein [Minicystis sp.]